MEKTKNWDLSEYEWIAQIRIDVASAMAQVRIVSVVLTIILLVALTAWQKWSVGIILVISPAIYWMVIPLSVQMFLALLSEKRLMKRKQSVIESFEIQFRRLEFPSPCLFQLKIPFSKSEHQVIPLVEAKEWVDWVDRYLVEIAEDNHNQIPVETKLHASMLLQYMDSLLLFPGMDTVQLKIVQYWLYRIWAPSVVKVLASI